MLMGISSESVKSRQEDSALAPQSTSASSDAFVAGHSSHRLGRFSAGGHHGRGRYQTAKDVATASAPPADFSACARAAAAALCHRTASVAVARRKEPRCCRSPSSAGIAAPSAVSRHLVA